MTGLTAAHCIDEIIVKAAIARLGNGHLEEQA
jgi:hypothetical protein